MSLLYTRPLPPFGSPPHRVSEYEADSIGLRLMARAGNDPHASTSMLGKLGDMERKDEVGVGRGGACLLGDMEH